MKTIAIATAVALSGFAAMGADNTSATPSSSNCTLNNDKPANCCKDSKDAKCNDCAWVDIETITIEAANGDPIAQYAIAYITDNGMGETAKDPEKAKEMYSAALPGLEKAAEDGNAHAARALAHMYTEGKGVEKNPEKAKQYMEMCRKDEAKAADEQKEGTPAANKSM